jgi:hypothetical protein
LTRRSARPLRLLEGLVGTTWFLLVDIVTLIVLILIALVDLVALIDLVALLHLDDESTSPCHVRTDCNVGFLKGLETTTDLPYSISGLSCSIVCPL